MNIFQIIGIIILVLLFSAGLSFLINQSSIQLVGSQYEVITTDNVDTIFSQINYGDIVEIEGTIDYLRMVSDQPQDISQTTYFAGLKEFGNKFIIRFPHSKLTPEKIKFTGKVLKINDDEFSKTLISKLNAPLDFSTINVSADQLDVEVKQKIAEQSVGNFNESTILVLDGVLIDDADIYLNFIITFVVIFVFIITLFRKKIFALKRKQMLQAISTQ